MCCGRDSRQWGGGSGTDPKREAGYPYNGHLYAQDGRPCHDRGAEIRISGYRDFDYAQQAIRLGVCRFLLKPSIMDELNEAIRTMVERLESKAPACRTEDGPREEETEEAENAAGSFIVKNALAYMEENYAERLKLVDVADKVYVSQWHLSKLLNKFTGHNFSELLNDVRMKRAKELLGDPSLRISDIAEEVGFLDMAHFSRVFKKLAGVSANEYRNTVSVPQKTEP